MITPTKPLVQTRLASRLLLSGLLLVGCAKPEEAPVDQASGRAEDRAQEPRPPLTVFADEPFYRERKEREEVLIGTLRKREVREGPNTRALPYRLQMGEQELPIYVAGFDGSALSPFLDHEVEVRGKRIDQSAEGFGVEIWPGAIRRT